MLYDSRHTSSRHQAPKIFPFNSKYEVSIMADSSQADSKDANLLEKVKEILTLDANRWEKVFAHIKKIQDNAAGASIYDFDAKLVKQFEDHVKGLRAMAKLLEKEHKQDASEDKSIPSVKDNFKDRFSMIELD